MVPISKHRCGPYLVDFDNRTLRDGSAIATLPPKAMDLLRLLMERPDAVVSKEEIFARLWPDTAVSDGALSQLVYQIRVATAGRELIVTIPKRGYRLALAAAGDSVTETSESTTTAWRSKFWVVAAAILSLVAGGWVFGLLTAAKVNPEVVDLLVRAQGHYRSSLAETDHLRSRGMIDAAQTLVDRALETQPNDPDAMGTKALISCATIAAGFGPDTLLPEVERMARAAIAARPKTSYANAALACAGRLRGNVEESLRYAIEVAKLPDSSGESSAIAGQAFFSAGMMPSALQMFRRALAHNPELVQARTLMGRALLHLDRPQECIQALSPLVKRKRMGDWVSELCHVELGNWLEAIAAGEAAVTSRPESLAGAYELGQTYRRAGREADALRVWRAGIGRIEGMLETQENARARMFLALNYAQLGEKQAARTSLGLIRPPMSEEPWFLFQAGLVEAIVGRDDAAMDLLERAVRKKWTGVHYFRWHFRPERGVATLGQDPRYKRLLTELDNQIQEREKKLSVWR